MLVGVKGELREPRLKVPVGKVEAKLELLSCVGKLLAQDISLTVVCMARGCALGPVLVLLAVQQLSPLTAGHYPPPRCQERLAELSACRTTGTQLATQVTFLSVDYL